MAIYEVGVLDDGALVGLSRREMRASLDTLEAMASHLGARVEVRRVVVVQRYPGLDPTRDDGRLGTNSSTGIPSELQPTGHLHLSLQTASTTALRSDTMSFISHPPNPPLRLALTNTLLLPPFCVQRIPLALPHHGSNPRSKQDPRRSLPPTRARRKAKGITSRYSRHRPSGSSRCRAGLEVDRWWETNVSASSCFFAATGIVVSSFRAGCWIRFRGSRRP
ncbi:hypothetical protein CF327_g6816 [Tilletia walkeri]|nr:hypothetical protein CF327_g6816 [Tilletia walkeri]